MKFACGDILSVVLLLMIFLEENEILGSLVNDDICGEAVITRSSSFARIVNGSASVQGQWPWQVAIVDRRDGLLFFVCGGTLIKNGWVLTAAHCVDNTLISDPVTSIRVYMGMNDRNDPYESSRQIRQLRNFTCHPGYKTSTSFMDDLCLLHLSEPVTYTTYIRPACLPENGTSIIVGDSCVISGWGETEGTGDNSILRYATVSILNHTTCSTWYLESNIVVPDNHFCAGYENGGIDSCQGDSGGPLVCLETVSGRNAYALRGITSFGLGCADVRRPGVYVDVVKYSGWIEEVISSSSRRMCDCHAVLLLGFSMLLTYTLHGIWV